LFLATNQQSTLKRLPGLSEIPNRFVKHNFRAENSCLSWESLSAGRWLAKWREGHRGNRTLFGTPASPINARLNHGHPISGNSNDGHEYGTGADGKPALSPDRRRQLLEYLKRL
jgi:hypothetical protein